MDAQFPLFVFEKDDRSMYLIETPRRILYRLETIDIENNEYLFWDSTGAGVRISVTPSALKRIELCDQTMSLREAFDLSFAKTPRQANFIHVTCYTAPLYAIDFKCTPNFDEAQRQLLRAWRGRILSTAWTESA